MSLRKGGRFVSSTSTLRRKQPLRKQAETKDIQECKVVAKVTCNNNSNYNQFVMHIFVLLSEVNDIGEDGLDLNKTIANSQNIFKRNSSLTLESFEYFEYMDNDRTTLIYKVIGLTKSQPHRPYDKLNFQIGSDEGALVSRFMEWYSMGHHGKSIFHCLTHVYGIIKTEKYYYLFDPNVEGKGNSDGKHTCAVLQCVDLSHMVKFLHSCVTKKESHIEKATCNIIAVGILKPLTSLQLYVTSNPNYDKRHETRQRKITESDTVITHLKTGERRISTVYGTRLRRPPSQRKKK